mgnify:FL=1
MRESEELSQKDFAEILNISKQQLCDIEKGRRAVSIQKGASFADRLGYPPKTFVSLIIKDQIRESGLDLDIKIS